MVRKLKHCCYLIPELFGLWFHWMGVSVITIPLEGADLAKYTRYVRKLVHDSQRNQILMGKNIASRFCRAAFKEWVKSYVRLENTLHNEPFSTNKHTYPTFLVHSLICSFFFQK